MNNEPKKYNDIIYGEAKIIAVDMNKWRLPCGSTTTSHVRARNAAIKMNRIMGGIRSSWQRMSAGIK